MTEFWVSREKFYCKYCKIYLADDVPSKTHHDSGLRHKGNYERYIRDIYKKGEREIKDKLEEAKEIARMDAAAQLAMAADGIASTSTLSPRLPTPPSKKPKSTSSSDPYANYSTAESLGYIDPNEEALKAYKAQIELKQTEGIIGGWEKVVSTSKSKPKVKKVKEEDGEGVLEGGEEEEKKVEMAMGNGNAEAIATGERPGGNYLSIRKEPLLDKEEEVYDPSKLIGGIKLKRARLTLQEEETLRLEEETKLKLSRKGMKEIDRFERREAKKTKAGWNSINVEDEPEMDFDALVNVKSEETIKAEEGIKIEGEGENVGNQLVVEKEDEKPSVVVANSGFRKRKMLGASATRKK